MIFSKEYIDIALDSQRRAANPRSSVCVNASAGTGKTKVLVDRVVRLLLPDADGKPPARPDKILCITYTKAAAAEMTHRLLRHVQKWAVCPEDALAGSLTDIIGATPTGSMIQAARGLFARLVDGPYRVRVMTIHAFCQSILARFPLEAGVRPHFTLIEDLAAKDLLETARAKVFARARQDEALRAHIEHIAGMVSDDSLGMLIDNMLFEQRQLSYTLAACPPQKRAVTLKHYLGLQADDTPEKWARDVVHLDAALLSDLKKLQEGLASGTKNEMELAAAMDRFLAVLPTDRANVFPSLLQAFYTQNMTPRSAGTHQGARSKDPGLAALYLTCSAQVAALYKRRQLLDLVAANESLLYVGEAIIGAYERLKRGACGLDYDDLIRYTHRLLTRAGGEAPNFLSWVMYKLDGGIDHILVDEAQDTNPEQWEIVKTLSKEFLGQGDTAARPSRSLFIVGDQKQSIYRFQGADAEKFMESVTAVSPSKEQGERTAFEKVQMNVSFRTVPPVLKMVDQVFARPDHFSAFHMAEGPVHLPRRAGQGGSVSLWPLVRADEKDEDGAPWTAPMHSFTRRNIHVKLAQKIAAHIHGLLARGEMLASHARPLCPGDIMILTQKRRPLMPYLVSALQQQGVPVGGLDRMQILDDLAVQDCVSAALFALCPEDDLSLAEVMTSPFMNMTDKDLIRLAPTRAGSLYRALKDHQDYAVYIPFLENLIVQARVQTPYTFFYQLLSKKVPGEEKSGRTALTARLGAAAREPLELFLDHALMATQEGQALYPFIHRLRRDNPEIKRENNAHQNVVRIMTVHGSKGLEAPMVILADAMTSTRKPKEAGIFWPDKTGIPLPIWAPRAGDRPDALRVIEENEEASSRAEYKRLLYVAMTRAQDHLIIAGSDKGAYNDLQSWYVMVKEAFEGASHLDGYTRTVIDADQDDVLYELRALPTAAPDRASAPEEGEKTTLPTLPSILMGPPPPEQVPARPLRPERPSAFLSPRSPLETQHDQEIFQRGIYVHKLLQILPDLPPAARAPAAQAYVDQQAASVGPAARQGMVRDVLRVLDHPDFAPLFGPGSRAEVPITGMLPGGHLMAGQIDRLLIAPDRIWVVDYKTNRAPPAQVADAPPAYLAQMRAYRDLLAAIYPDRPISCALLWTHTAALMPLPEGF